MLKNYLKVALRNLWRHKGYTVINLIGLALGLACCLLIVLFVQDELAYDRFHTKAERIYRVVNAHHSEGGVKHNAVTPPRLAPAMEQAFPEVQEAVRFFMMGEQLVKQDEQTALLPDVLMADANVFEVFSFELLQGDPATALQDPFALVLTEQAAQQFFPNQNPMGQTVRMDDEWAFTVTGVMRDLPEGSHMKVGALGSFATLERLPFAQDRITNWRWQQFFTYVLLRDGYDPAQLETKLAALTAEQADPQTRLHGFTHDFSLQPLTDVHLRSSHLTFDWINTAGNIAYVYAFSAIALFILLLACVNFMNLATARSMKRAREVGMRKVLGAQRGQLIRQFLGESVLMSLAALVLAVVLAHLALPALNAFANKTLSLSLGQHKGLWLGLVPAAILVGVVAGSYPALYLSAFRPLAVLRSGSRGRHGLPALRRVLVVLQFTISIFLIIATGAVYNQLEYMRSKQLGFDKEQLVVLPLRNNAMQERFETLKAEVLRDPAIAKATVTYGAPGAFVAGDGIRPKGSDAEVSINMMIVDYDFMDTYGTRTVAGRGFSEAHPSDADHAFVLNEAAAARLDWTPQEAVGQELAWDIWGSEDDSLKTGRIIGVVENFHYYSLHRPVEPMVLHIHEARSHLAARILPGATAAALDHLKAVWSEWASDWPFEYSFVDAEFDAMYRTEQKLGWLFAASAGLAILIACLGLFGLTSYSTERRTKEIGVRKVLGASVASIVALLSKDFLKLVLVALVLATPLAYVAMQAWLEGFAYRITLGPGLFIAAGATALLIALLTVSYQSIKAALSDPVKSLRYE